MENSNEGVAQDVERDGDNNQEEGFQTDLTLEQAVLKLRESAEENKRYRKTKAELKAESDELKARLKTLEENAQKEKGNYQDLYGKTKEELEAERTEKKRLIGTYAKRVVHGSVKEKLLESKCSRPDAILKLMGEQIGSLEIDEDFNPDASGIELIVSEAQKDYPEWFKSETPQFNDAKPAGKIPAKGINEMSKEEILASLKAMDK